MFNKREKQLQQIIQAFALAMARSPHEHILDDLGSFLSREDLELLIDGITDQANAVASSVTDDRQQRLYDLAIELNNRLKQ
jgi:hypothetical protein